MKYKKYFLFVLSLIYFILALTFITNAGDNTINFYNFQASGEKITKSEIIILALTDPQTKSLTIELENNELIASQLKIETSQDIYSFDKHKTKLSIPVHNNDLLNEEPRTMLLILSYTVYPEDKPGTYEGQLIFTQNDKDHKFLLQATVQPWLKLETKTNTHHINQRIGSENKIISELPGTLLIYGNISWQLFFTKDTNNSNYPEQLQLNLIQQNDNFLVPKDNINLNDRYVLLAEGESPGNDFIEVPFFLTVKNYSQIKAGQINFPLSFQINSQNN